MARTSIDLLPLSHGWGNAAKFFHNWIVHVFMDLVSLEYIDDIIIGGSTITENNQTINKL